MRCRFYCCWSCYYTTGRAYAGQIFPVGVDVMLPFLLLLVLLLHYGEGKRCSNFRRWCRRCVAVFTAVGAAVTLRRRQMLLKFSPLVWALRCRFYCCWCCYYTTARKCCSKFRRWCGRCDAVFTAVDAAITPRRGQMLLKFSPLV